MRREIQTNKYISLQISKEKDTRGSTTRMPFIPFHTNVQFQLIKHNVRFEN